MGPPAWPADRFLLPRGRAPRRHPLCQPPQRQHCDCEVPDCERPTDRCPDGQHPARDEGNPAGAVRDNTVQYRRSRRSASIAGPQRTG